MSGEFRWVTSSYFHYALEQAADNVNDAESHEVSRALTKLYKAIAPIEKGCAWFEAGDSGRAEPTIQLLRNIDNLKEAAAELTKLAREAQERFTRARAEGIEARSAIDSEAGAAGTARA